MLLFMMIRLQEVEQNNITMHSTFDRHKMVTTGMMQQKALKINLASHI